MGQLNSIERINARQYKVNTFTNTKHDLINALETDSDASNPVRLSNLTIGKLLFPMYHELCEIRCMLVLPLHSDYVAESPKREAVSCSYFQLSHLHAYSDR